MASVSGRGKGIWQTMATLNAYRLRRNRARRRARQARKRNRGR